MKQIEILPVHILKYKAVRHKLRRNPVLKACIRNLYKNLNFLTLDQENLLDNMYDNLVLIPKQNPKRFLSLGADRPNQSVRL